MSEREISEIAEWAAEKMRATFREVNLEIDELGVAILYMFIRRLLVDYWTKNKIEFVEEEMRELCFALCNGVPTQTEDSVIMACETFFNNYANFIREFEEAWQQN